MDDNITPKGSDRICPELRDESDFGERKNYAINFSMSIPDVVLLFQNFAPNISSGSLPSTAKLTYEFESSQIRFPQPKRQIHIQSNNQLK
jgi:hypothetical protein